MRDGSHVSIQFVNERVDTMPDRIKAVLDGDAAMTGLLMGGCFGNCISMVAQDECD